jgi:hypothetical protein
MKNRFTRIQLLPLLGALGLFAAACTSSNSPVGTSGTNSQYDSQYRNPTATNPQTYGEQQPVAPVGDPAITIMQMKLDTGEVHPGDDYDVHAIVDNPDNRAVEYVWSTDNGEITEVPEADRGRLMTLVETEYATASVQAPGAPPATGDTSVPSMAPDGTTSAAPPAVNPDGTPITTGTPVGSTPFSSSPGVTVVEPDPVTQSQGSSGTQPVKTEPQVDPSAPPRIQDLMRKQFAGEKLTEAEQQEFTNWQLQKAQTKPTANAGAVYERRIIAGPGDENDDVSPADEETRAESDIPEDATIDIDAAESSATDIDDADAEVDIEVDVDADDLPVDEELVYIDREDPSPSGNAIEAEATVGDLDVEAGDDGSLRGEYSTWTSDDDGDVRRRDLGDDEDDTLEDDDAPITPEEAYEALTLVTTEPFIRWTPTVPGDARLFLQVRFKDDELTAITELPVEVILEEASVELSDEFPDVIREDDSVLVRLEGDNIPDFKKGLFTVSFDPNVLSFREAELGEFFDDAPDADIYFAQPDKMDGKVLLAIDSNTEVSEMSGTGPVAYLKFKAKQDITDREATQLALVQDTASQYILDLDGENVLPLPVERPVFQTALVMPPVLPGYERQPGHTPGTGTLPSGESATAPAGTKPGTQTQAGTGPTVPGTQPPANTGSVVPSTTGTGGPVVPSTTGGNTIIPPNNAPGEAETGTDPNAEQPQSAAGSR